MLHVPYEGHIIDCHPTSVWVDGFRKKKIKEKIRMNYLYDSRK